MNNYSWRERYTTFDGADITSNGKYISKLGLSTGDGSRMNPYNENYSVNSANLIFGCGSFNLNSTPSYIVGTSMTQSIINIDKNIGLKAYMMTLNLNIASGNSFTYAQNCIINVINNSGSYAKVLNCIINGQTCGQINNTFVSASGITGLTGLTNKCLYNACTIVVNQTLINNSNASYIGLSNCLYQIGAEAAPTALSGVTADDLRTDFINRCTAQGLTLPTYTEFDYTAVPVGRWLFSNTSITASNNTRLGSELDLFCIIRGFYIGHSTQGVTDIPITLIGTTPASISPDNPNTSVVISEGAATLDASVDLITRNQGNIQSNVIWMGGLKQFEQFNIAETLARSSGVNADNTDALTRPAVTSGNILADSFYIVRSSDNNAATITYNGKTYDTSLSTRNNIFKGVTGVTTFTGDPTAEIYEIIDQPNYGTIQMRIVNALPTPPITTGSLQSNYWYFVAPDNVADTTGTVTYNGKVYPCYSSFLVGATLTFTLSGNVHLRRCWREDYTQATELTDASFWASTQKPQWIDVHPDDMRCLLAGNSSASQEMATDVAGNYIASGHPEFYANVSGDSGTILPAYKIKGSFYQFRIVITTQNPM